jgi:hypothetical protein
MGIPKGFKRTKPQYNINYLDINSVNPEWINYQCSSYEDIINILQTNHNIKYTRNILQNIALNRYSKLKRYPNITIDKIVYPKNN